MVAWEQNSIVDMFRPVALSELDMPAYRDWRDKRVIAMMRLGLLVGSVLFFANFTLDLLIDPRVAARNLPYRGLISIVVLLFGASTYLPTIRRHPDALFIVINIFLAVVCTVITARLPIHAGFVLVSGEMVIGIFIAIIMLNAITVAVSVLALFAIPFAIYPLLGGIPPDFAAATVVSVSGFSSVILLSYLREQSFKRTFQLMVDLESAATTDLLTGLPNRSRIIAIAETEFHRADRFDTTVSVLMVAIDHFKLVNDTHGHAAGDTMLRAFAETCGRAIRGVDRMGRVGGEEFLVVLGDTDEKVALGVAERIRGAVEAMAVSTLHGEIRITVSIGAATRRSSEESIDLVLYRADQALYRAKAEGRNRISAAAA